MSDSDFLSFQLPDEFVRKYASRKVNWGFPIGGGNSLGELTFLSKYSRKKKNGKKERWHETCRRVIEGMYSILKDHCEHNRTPWNEYKAQKAAQDAYDRMFCFKWTPPGRGLWMMGTEFVNGKRNSAALQNCSFVSTEKLSHHSAKAATLPFVRLMEMSMLGVGVGFDTKGESKITLYQPHPMKKDEFVVEDSREGWCDSVAVLLESYFFKNRNWVVFDYSQVRPAGEPIVGFGGTAAGPEPLEELHEQLRRQLSGREGELLTSVDIVDIMNLIGKCVVAGNVRRSAELALGDPHDQAFLDLKNFEVNPTRMGIKTDVNGKPVLSENGSFQYAGGWGFASNNSVSAVIGEVDYDEISSRIEVNGEPGLLYLDLCQKYGRLIDPANNVDWRVAGTNPCSEQSLESFECCTLVETFLPNHDSFEDYAQTLKHAYLYGKAVTLLPTHWHETNEIMQRNRRIGCSMTGVAQFVESHGWVELRKWMNNGYDVVRLRDGKYSEWLGVRESIKATSIKPSGTVSLLAGVTPGVHWPTAAGFFFRRVRYSKSDPMAQKLIDAGYPYESDVQEPDATLVFTFPAIGPDIRSEREVSLWEKAELAVVAQRYWADNQVSVTVTFTPDEQDQIPALLQAKEGQLKSVSFLPLGDQPKYAQMPYEAVDREMFDKVSDDVHPIDFKALYGGEALDAEGERFCNNDTCLI